MGGWGYPQIHVVCVLQWEQFMKLGDDMENSVVEKNMAGQKPEQCALLVYTVSDSTAVINNSVG